MLDIVNHLKTDGKLVLTVIDDLILNRLFTRGYINTLIEGKCGTGTLMLAAKHCGVNYYGRNYGDIITDVFQYLSKQYRNEYYYKNTLLNKLVFGKYKPTTAAALTEITVGNARADFILVNGKAVVFEIKTEQDNLDRLSYQIQEYYKAFRYVTVATYLDNYETVFKSLDNPHTGICIISQSGTIDRKHGREATEYSDELEAEAIFHILRKKEFEDIIINSIGSLPQCTTFHYYNECFSIIRERLSLQVFQQEMEKRIKKRPRIDIGEIKQIPYELRNIAYFSGYQERDYSRLNAFLKTSSDSDVKETPRCIFQF